MRIVSRLVVLAVVLALSVVAVAQANHTTTIYPGQVQQIPAGDRMQH